MSTLELAILMMAIAIVWAAMACVLNHRPQPGDCARVVSALRSSQALTSAELVLATKMDVGRVFVALAKLESAGTIEGFWVMGPYPRSRRYFLRAGRSSHAAAPDDRPPTVAR